MFSLDTPIISITSSNKTGVFLVAELATTSSEEFSGARKVKASAGGVWTNLWGVAKSKKLKILNRETMEIHGSWDHPT